MTTALAGAVTPPNTGSPFLDGVLRVAMALIPIIAFLVAIVGPVFLLILIGKFLAAPFRSQASTDRKCPYCHNGSTTPYNDVRLPCDNCGGSGWL